MVHTGPLHSSRGCHSNIHCTTICDWGQGRSRSIFDFDRWFLAKISLNCWPVPFIFAIFLCTTYLRSFDHSGKTVWPLFFVQISLVHWPFTLTAVADRSTVAIGVTPPCSLITIANRWIGNEALKLREKKCDKSKVFLVSLCYVTSIFDGLIFHPGF